MANAGKCLKLNCRYHRRLCHAVPGQIEFITPLIFISYRNFCKTAAFRGIDNACHGCNHH